MDIYRYFQTSTSTHSNTNAYLLALASKYIYEADLPPGNADFTSRFRTHFRGLSDTDPFLSNTFINDGVEAAVMSNSRVIIVTFRGTEVSTDLEWVGGIGNLGYGFYQTPSSWSHVKLHDGFYHGQLKVSADLIKKIETLREQQDRPVFITGHSRGGAFALIFAYQLKAVQNIDVAGVYVYGCPRVGDEKFEERYRANGLWDITFRWVNTGDSAPTLPEYAVLIGKNRSNQYFHVGQANVLSGGEHAIDNYTGRMYGLLSNMQRSSVTQPAFLTEGDPGGVFPVSSFDPPVAQLAGEYTIRQKNNNRFVDAYENTQNDFSLVTRTAQNNDSQRWILSHLEGDTYTIQHKVNGRFVDAHENSQNDFSLVTRTAQNNDSQRWILSNLGGDTFTIQHKVNGRFVDAHENSQNNFSLVTRTTQNNDSQRWRINPF